MRSEILVDITPQQTRVALLEDNSLAEIYIERAGRERLVGNIYKGRVQNVLPGMQAAFVDIGLERNAFLYAGDVLVDRSDFEFDDAPNVEIKIGHDIKDMLKINQEIMVQVVKESNGAKGHRVTTHITLPGRTLVLMPTVNYIGVSRRIKDETERARLRGLLEKIKPENMGVIVRTAAEGKTGEEFQKDLEFLKRLWERILQKDSTLSVPRLIHKEEQLAFRIIRDLFTPMIDKLVVNSNEYFERLGIVAGIVSPELKDRVELYSGEEDLFTLYGIEEKITKALDRRIWLKNGAHIVIDQTEALTVIDVNTGKFVGSNDLQQTICDVNCEAAKEIARQLRLRDISGIVIIDFIDMESGENREKLLSTLHEELAKDRTKSNVLGITALGLIEMTRKKMRNNLSATLESACPYCKGKGRVLSPVSVAFKLRRHLCRLVKEGETYVISLHPFVAEALEQKGILKGLAGDFYIQNNDALHIEEYEIQTVDLENFGGIESLRKV